MDNKIDKVINHINEVNPEFLISFRLNIHPEPYARPRKSSILAKNGRANIFYNPKSKYKTALRKQIKQELEKYDDFSLIDGEVSLKLTFGITPPKSISDSKMKTELAKLGVIHPITRPDIDNYAKIIQDAFNELIYKDDGQIWNLNVCKVYSFEEEFIDIEVQYRELPIKLR